MRHGCNSPAAIPRCGAAPARATLANREFAAVGDWRRRQVALIEVGRQAVFCKSKRAALMVLALAAF